MTLYLPIQVLISMDEGEKARETNRQTGSDPANELIGLYANLLPYWF